MKKKDIKLFVRRTLGCACPEEVFDRIECRSDVSSGCGIVLDYEIDVGGRLLVFVLILGQAEAVEPVVTALVRAGTEKRDREGFNRIRLVLLSDDPEAVSKTAFEAFESLDTDEKVHLHVLSNNDFPNERAG